MNYTTFNPPPELERYLRCYWVLESGSVPLPPSRDRVFPDGCIELIFHYGDLFKKYNHHNVAHIQPRAFIHGQLKKFMDLEPTGHVGIFSARFNPGGLQAFVNFEVSKITGDTITFEEAWPGKGKQLENKMLLAKGTEERRELVETFLTERLLEYAVDSQLTEYCVNHIISHGGHVSLEALAEKFKLSKRSLERLFNHAVGLSPKLFCRIIRFNNALHLIEKKDFRSFTSVAHEGGFYDQAHFIKDFKALTGLNPKKYFSENHEMVKFFNL